MECADSPPDWNAIFGRDAPLFLEIGGGGGEGAAALAEANPQNNYVAMEVYAPGVGALLNKLAAMQLQNARAVCADAATSLDKMFTDGSLCGAHIFFPDPWPKKKHHKRRLLNAAFADLLAKKIRVGGFVQMATDWRNYAEQIEEGFGAHPHFVAATAAEANCPPRPPTRFAARAAKENRPPADFIYLRR